MFGFHAWDLLIVLLIALVIFGPKKLPEIGGAVGKSIREFKKATNEITESIQAPPSKTPEAKQISSTPAASTVSPELKPATPEVVASEQE
jgi:sec-independent protein translocase protein TatA